jgi:guanylate kinase
MWNEGTLYIIAAPSGAGKTSLVNALINKTSAIKVSISYTTRPQRPGEKHGVNYFFVDQSEFENMVIQKVFLEHAFVHDYYYGTSRQKVEEDLKAGIDVILEIDWQGARQVREKFPNCITIFIMPPSREELKKRLEARKQDQPEVIERRFAIASVEMSHYREFDYLIVNKEFEEALADLQAIVHANRLKMARQAARHAKLLAELAQN